LAHTHIRAIPHSAPPKKQNQGRDFARNNKYVARTVDRTPLDVDKVCCCFWMMASVLMSPLFLSSSLLATDMTVCCFWMMQNCRGQHAEQLASLPLPHTRTPEK
jgi:hypothetical protein